MGEIVRCDECGKEITANFQRSSYWRGRKPLCEGCEAKPRRATVSPEDLEGVVSELDPEPHLFSIRHEEFGTIRCLTPAGFTRDPSLKVGDRVKMRALRTGPNAAVFKFLGRGSDGVFPA